MLGNAEFEDLRPGEKVAAIIVGGMVRCHMDVWVLRRIGRLKSVAYDVRLTRFDDPKGARFSRGVDRSDKVVDGCLLIGAAVKVVCQVVEGAKEGNSFGAERVQFLLAAEFVRCIYFLPTLVAEWIQVTGVREVNQAIV